MKGIAIFELKLNDLARQLRMIKPESQKIGNPVIKPVIPSALELLFFPVFDSMKPAILRVPPVLSRATPIMVPKMIRNPIEPIVLPKPSFIVEITLSAGMVNTARKRETINRETNALIFSRDVRNTIAAMLMIIKNDIDKVFIRVYPKNR